MSPQELEQAKERLEQASYLERHTLIQLLCKVVLHLLKEAEPKKRGRPPKTKAA